jgi:hypothetical protein
VTRPRKKFEISINILTVKGLQATSVVLDLGSDNDLISKPLVLAFRFQISNKLLREIRGLNRDPRSIYSLVETKL